MKTIPGGVTAPLGFRAAGIYCGIKKKKQLDLALLVSEQEGPIAGVFTTNRVVAAPVVLDRLHFKKDLAAPSSSTAGMPTPAPAPKGCARQQTWRSWWPQRYRALPIPFSSDRPESSANRCRSPVSNEAHARLCSRGSRRRGGREAAQAIMTTDLKPKQVAVRARLGGQIVTVGGMAKGSGMIHPNMATMLAYLTTDAAISRRALQHGTPSGRRSIIQLHYRGWGYQHERYRLVSCQWNGRE